jgi:hypothetical protein
VLCHPGGSWIRFFSTVIFYWSVSRSGVVLLIGHGFDTFVEVLGSGRGGGVVLDRVFDSFAVWSAGTGGEVLGRGFDSFLEFFVRG